METYSNNLADYHLELGVFAFLTFLSTIHGLNLLSGNLSKSKIHAFLAARKFIQDPNSDSNSDPDSDSNCEFNLMIFFQVVGYVLLFMPFLSLLIWVIIVFKIRWNDTLVAPISMVLVGFGTVFIFMGLMSIRWQRYKNNIWSIVCVIIGFAMITAYQLMALFYYSITNSFFGISALFFSYNCITIIFLSFVNIGKKFVDFDKILKKITNEVPVGSTQINDQADIFKSIETCANDENYFLTDTELRNYFTIKPNHTELLVSGIVFQFSQLEPWKQYCINIFLYLSSLGILIVYAIIIYYTNEKDLGAMTAIAVFLSDLILFALYHSDILTSIGGISIFAIAFRGLLFSFGGSYWYFGFCLLYSLAGAKIVWEKAQRQFPIMESEKYTHKEKIGDPNSKSKKQNNENENPPSKGEENDPKSPNKLNREKENPPSKGEEDDQNLSAKYKKDILKEPILVWIFVTGLFGILSVVLAYANFSGVPLPSVPLNDTDFPFWIVGVFAFLFVIFCYIIISIVRISIRRSIAYVTKTHQYCFCQDLDEFWMYALLGSSLIICIALVVYVFIRDSLLLVYPFFIPIIILTFVYITNHYALNNFSILKVYGKEENEKTEQPIKTEECNTSKHLSKNPNDQEKSEQGPKDSRENCSFIVAFFTKKLHIRDYKIIFGMIFEVILIFFLAFTIQMLPNSPYPPAWIGVTSSIMIFDAFIIIAPLINHATNGMSIRNPQWALVILGFCIHIIYGIYWYQVANGGDMDIHYNKYTLPIYAAIEPGLISLFLGIQAWRERNGLCIFCYVCWGITLLCLGILIMFVYFEFGWVYGTIVFVIALSVILLIIFLGINVYVPTWVWTLCFIFVVLAAIAIMILSFCMQVLDNFTAFSISINMIIFGLFLASAFSIILAILNFPKEPILFSCYLFPVYRYTNGNEGPYRDNTMLIVLLLTMVAFFYWTVSLSIYVVPMHYGVSAGEFTIVFIILICLLLCSYSPSKFQEWEKNITKEVIRSCWLIAKKKYIDKRDVEVDEEVPTPSTIVAFLKDNSYVNKQRYCHKIFKKVERLFWEEFEFFINFQMLALQSAQNVEIQNQVELFKFLRTYDKQLREKDIIITYKTIANNDTRHASILSQIAQLEPEQQYAYKDSWNKFQTEKKEKAKRQKLEEEEFKALLEAQKNRPKSQTSEEYNKLLAEYNDALEKANDALKKSNDTNDGKYTDPDKNFPKESQIIKKDKPEVPIKSERASTFQNAVLFSKEKNLDDIVQGNLGDCYLISAMSVLKEEHIKNCFILPKDIKPEDAVKAGAFLVRLFNGGEEEVFVLVDDYFYKYTDNPDWVYVHSDRSNEKERVIWPMVLEKAYAKMYGGYDKIEGGLIHIALAELTGCVPQLINIATEYGDHIDQFWNKLLAYHENGYLLGASTPNTEITEEVSQKKMVKGHAYSILDVREYKDNHLIKLRNPHGKAGEEWDGDWGDKDKTRWTEGALISLTHKKADDGIFWMNINDFASEFKYLCVGREFDEKRWEKLLPGQVIKEYILN